MIEPLLPPGAEDRVTRAVKNANQQVRNLVRDETGLRLNDGDGRSAVPVKVVEGFPVPLAELIDRNPDPVTWRVILAQPKLEAVIDGLGFLLADWERFERWDGLPLVASGGRPALNRAMHIAMALHGVSITRQVEDQMRMIEEDILGTYYFPRSRSAWVEIYWMPVAMVAGMLDVRPEDLAVVVLAHELAHAYTHLGRDIDGRRWDDEGFGGSDLAVVEGLAQFYTQSVAARLSDRSPGVETAFERLLRIQGKPYTQHQTWLSHAPRQRGEAVRFSMINARTRGPVRDDEWQRMLETASDTLRKNDPAVVLPRR